MELEQRVKVTEEKQKEMDRLMFGNLQEVGVLPTLVLLSDTMIGKNGDGGFRKQIEDNRKREEELIAKIEAQTRANADTLRDAKNWMRGAVAVLTFLFTIITIVITKIWK